MVIKAISPRTCNFEPYAAPDEYSFLVTATPKEVSNTKSHWTYDSLCYRKDVEYTTIKGAKSASLKYARRMCVVLDHIHDADS